MELPRQPSTRVSIARVACLAEFARPAAILARSKRLQAARVNDVVREQRSSVPHLNQWKRDGVDGSPKAFCPCRALPTRAGHPQPKPADRSLHECVYQDF